MLRKTLASTVILLSTLMMSPCGVSNELQPEDWSGINDYYGGFKESNFVDHVYYVASKTGIYNKSSTYIMPEGYRWMSTQEYADLFSGVSTNNLAYWNAGGWDGYVFEGVSRVNFIFSDTSETAMVMHAGFLEGTLGAYGNAYTDSSTALTVSNFAGFVLFNEGAALQSAASSNASDVSVPLTSIGLLVSGLGLVLLRKGKNVIHTST